MPTHAQSVSAELVDELPAWTLIKAYHLMARRFYRTLGDAGMAPTQFGVLITLQVNPDIGQGALAREIQVSPQSLGKLLTGMEDRGWVRRPAPPGRGRPRLVRLTAAGRRALGEALPSVLRLNAPESLSLTATEAAELNRLLHRILADAPGDESEP